MATTYQYLFNPFTGNLDEVVATIDAGSVTGGTPNTVAGWDASGNLETIPGWGIDTNLGGLTQVFNFTPADTVGGATYYINSVAADITPSADLLNLSFQGFQNYVNLHGPNDFLNYTGITNVINTSGTGDKGAINVLSQDLSLGDGTNVSTSQGSYAIITTVDVNDNHTASNSITGNATNILVHTLGVAGNVGITSGLVNLDGTLTGNVNLEFLSVNVNVDQPSGTGVSYLNYGGNINGAVQYTNGINFGPSVGATGSVANGMQSFLDNTQVASGGSINGLTSYGAFVQLHSGATVNNGYTAYAASPLIDTALTGNGLSGFILNAQMSSSMNFVNAFSSFANLNSGTNIINGYQVFDDNTQVHSGATLNQYTSVALSPSFQSGSILDTFTGVQVNALNDIAIPTVRLAQLGMYGSGSVTDLTGLSINLGGITSTQQKKGIEVNDGNINVNANYDTGILPASPGFISLNSIGGLFHIASGFPTTNTIVLADDIGVSAAFEDDMGPDPFGGVAGFANVGFVSQVIAAAGVTVDTYTSLLAAASCPPNAVTGGTISNVNSITAAGIINQGGSLNITNLRGLNIPSIFNSFSAANAWGVYVEDITVDNWFSKNVVIGGATGKPVGSESLSVTGSSYLDGDLDMVTHQIHNVVDPTAPQDAATKNYVDTFVSGITALTGDGTATGPGSAALTLATVNGNVGSFGSSTAIPSFTVNAKGLITAASTNVVIAPAGTLSGTTLNSTVVSSSLTSLGTQAQALDMNTHLINNVVDPVSAQDAATKNYVDTTTQPAGSYITALTGDVTASGPGSVAATLATVNANVGSFTNANITVNAKGLITAASNGSGSGTTMPTQQKFDTTGTFTYTAPVGLVYAVVTVIAGGGAGGGGATGGGIGGSGGGGGGGAKATLSAATIGASQTVVVGTGGASGFNGNNSSFGLLVIATGGTQGGSSGGTTGVVGGPGGIGTVGDVLVSGGDGAVGNNGVAAVYNGPGGNGGGSGFGFGGGGSGAPVNASSANGTSGTAYGGGGGGACGSGTVGSGFQGIVIVDEYY